MTFTLPENTLQRFLNLKSMGESLPVEIKTGGGLKSVEAVREDAKSLFADIEKVRVQAKAPYLEQGKLVDAAAKILAEPLDAIVTKCDRLRREYRDKVVNAMSKVQIVPDARPGEIPDMSANTGTLLEPIPVFKSRKHQTVVIHDEAAVPREFWTLNLPMIRAALLAGNSVPGAALEQTEILL
jgi:hypothetical protein